MDEETRTKPVIKHVIKSSTSSEKVFECLEEVLKEYDELLTKMKKEELERVQRDQFRRQQSEELQKAINDDLKKKEDQNMLERIKEAEIQSALDEKNRIAAEKIVAEKALAKLAQASAKLDVKSVCNIKMKLPSGETQMFKFPGSEKVSV